MSPNRVFTIPKYFLGVLAAALFLAGGCSAYYRTTAVNSGEPAPKVEDYQADEFVGMPIMGDYDDNPDLDFVLQVNDGERVFKVEAHEAAGDGNRDLLETVRKRINDLEDKQSLRVIGYYRPEYKGQDKEYGFLDLKCIVFIDNTSGQEEAYFTDPQDSRYYQSADVTVVYAPGHHLSRIHYPRYCSPWWDGDADGIPNRYDPWPFSYDIWYDNNYNFVPDWYDPYYCDYYPYWNYWSLDFWVGYRWYSPYWYAPYYYGPGFNTALYYDDYRNYTRLYDRTQVNREHPRGDYHLDVKSEALLRSGYSRGPRGSSVIGTTRMRGYDTLPADSRVLVSPDSRVRDSGAGDIANVSATDNTLRDTPDTFNRNREVTYDPAAPQAQSRERSGNYPAASSINKRKSPGAASTGDTPSVSRSRVSNSGGSTGTSSGSVSRSRGSSSEPVYVPVDRSRSGGTSGSANISPSGSSANQGSANRSRSSSAAPADRSRVAPSRDRSSSQPAASGSRSGSATSRSRSAPAPAASSAPSRSRSSGSAPAASSSGGSSRSRSSGSSSSSSSGSGDRRKR